MKQQLYKIGITGGIASGKSQLLKYLTQTQPRIYTINLDLLGHAIYQLNPIVVRNVKTIFGAEAVDNATNTINREYLGQLVFSDPYQLRILRSLVSPEIKRLLTETISYIEYSKSDKYDVIAVEGAVLVEARTYPMFDELWVTTLNKEDAVSRVMKRNNLSQELARDRVYSQITDEERLKYATFYYDTSDKAPFDQNVKLIEAKLQELRDRGILKS